MNRILVVGALLLIPALSSPTVWARPPAHRKIESLAEGPPKLMQGPLAPEAYKISKAKRLSKPELLWFNFNLARELGIEIPPEGVTPEFAQEVYRAFAKQIPAESDPASAFKGEDLDVWADGYGADDTVNLGSGRAASYGEVQVKGIGRTEHVRDPDPWHSNGAGYTGEAFRELFVGEVSNNEFSLGANRLIAVLSTGTVGATKDNPNIPRSLMVRYVDPVRPAHFIENIAAKTPEEISWDKKRVKAVIRNLPGALPQRAGAVFANEGERLQAGMHEWIRLFTLQLADAYTLRTHHGAYSVSNAMFNGALIDYGSITSLEGWTKYLTVGNGTPFGDINEPFDWIMVAFINGVQKNLPQEWKPYFPTLEEARKEFFDSYFKVQLPQRILQLTGIAPELLEKVKDSKEAMKMGELLVELTQAGNEQVYMNNGVPPPDTGTYDVRRITQKIAKGEKLTARDIADSGLRERVNAAAAEYLSVVEAQASKLHISTEALRTYMAHASERITRKLPETYNTRDNFEELWGEATQFYKDGDRLALQRKLDQRIERNTRIFKDTRPFELVVEQVSDPEHGVTLRKIFDLKSGKYSNVVRLAENDGKANFFGKIVEGNLKNSLLRVTLDPKMPATEIKAVKVPGFAEYRIESVKGQLPQAMALETADHRLIGLSKMPEVRKAWRKIDVKAIGGISENPCEELLRVQAR